MIELKRLKLINWHNFENVTFDCARLTYMIGVNAVGKTTILDAIRYCLTTNRNFNALGNKERPHPAGFGARKAARRERLPPPGPYRGLHRGGVLGQRQAHPLRHRGAGGVRRPHAGAAPRRSDMVSFGGRLHAGTAALHRPQDRCTQRKGGLQARNGPSLHPQPQRSAGPHLPCAGHRARLQPAGQKVQRGVPDGHQHGRDPQLPGVLYQYILPQPELDLDALQGDRLELENLHAVLAEAQTRADALEEIVDFGREAAEKQTQTLVNRGAALLARAAADGSEQTVWQEHLDAGRRQLEQLNARYAEAKNAEAEARRAYLSAHGAASASGEGRALDALTEELSRRKTALDTAARKAEKAESALARTQSLLAVLRRSGFAAGIKAEELTADTLPQLTAWLSAQEKPLEEAHFAARQNTAALQKEQAVKRAELDAVSGGKWVYPTAMPPPGCGMP